MARGASGFSGQTNPRRGGRRRPRHGAMTRKVLIVVLGVVLGYSVARFTAERGPGVHEAALEIAADPASTGATGTALVGALQSPAAARRVVAALDLTQDPVFAGATGWTEEEFGRMSIEGAAGFLLPPHGFIAAAVRGGPGGPVVVTATTPDAGLSVALVEAYAAEAPVAWREGLLRERESHAALLHSEAERQVAKLRRAEEAWAAFFSRHGAADFDEEQTAREAAMAARLEAVQQAEAEWRQLDDDLAAIPALDGDTGQMVRLPSFAADPEVREIRRRTGGTDEGETALSERILVILGQLEGRRARAEERLARLKRELAADEEGVRRAGVLQAQRSNLAAALETERKIHESLQDRLRSAGSGEMGGGGIVSVRRQEAVSVRAIPGALPADRLVFGALAGLLVSITAAFVVHFTVDRRLRDD